MVNISLSLAENFSTRDKEKTLGIMMNFAEPRLNKMFTLELVSGLIPG